MGSKYKTKPAHIGYSSKDLETSLVQEAMAYAMHADYEAFTIVIDLVLQQCRNDTLDEAVRVAWHKVRDLTGYTHQADQVKEAITALKTKG